MFLGAVVSLLRNYDLVERNREPDCFLDNARYLGDYKYNKLFVI